MVATQTVALHDVQAALQGPHQRDGRRSSIEANPAGPAKVRIFILLFFGEHQPQRRTSLVLAATAVYLTGDQVRFD